MKGVEECDGVRAKTVEYLVSFVLAWASVTTALFAVGAACARLDLFAPSFMYSFRGVVAAGLIVVALLTLMVLVDDILKNRHRVRKTCKWTIGALLFPLCLTWLSRLDAGQDILVFIAGFEVLVASFLGLGTSVIIGGVIGVIVAPGRASEKIEQ